ncbi:hypothetical protein ERJ77_17760 [Vibrio anguillarum]|uniref:DUF3265 domain-containing protein n=1 Tax=Vibrio anguillarum TaxID=55601 RepID=A0AAW4BG05_VIBAN|nr:hypothetical protein [Vibrio anguillarum]
MAFLLCVGFCDYGVKRKVSSSVGCPLSGRYVPSVRRILYYDCINKDYCGNVIGFLLWKIGK